MALGTEKWKYYLLGDGEREESTGYLYLELKKDGVEEYLTIGVGMRAQRGKGIDFWGFACAMGAVSGRAVSPFTKRWEGRCSP